MNITDKVIKALDARRGEWPTIAEQAEVSYSWITKFAGNKIPNPGIHTIERLVKILRVRV